MIPAVFFFVLLICQQSVSQTVYTPPDFSHARWKIQSDSTALSLTANPAFLAGVQAWSVGMSTERKFLIDGLTYSRIAAIVPIRGNALGICVSHSGISGFPETQVTGSYGKRLGGIDIGVQFNYNRIAIGGYGSASSFNAGMGLRWRLSDQMIISTQLSNITRSWFSKSTGERMGIDYSLAGLWKLSEKSTVNLIITKKENAMVEIECLFTYDISKRVNVSAGLNLVLQVPWIACGYTIRNIHIGITASWHMVLGYSPGLYILTTPKKKSA